MCRNTKKLCNYWDTTTKNATWAILMQSSNHFFTPILTLCQQYIQLGAKFVYMQWTREIYPSGNLYQVRETLFDALGHFGIKYTSQQKLLQNLPVFNFQSNFVQEETFKETNSTKWIGRHVPISVFIRSNLRKKHFSLQLWSSSGRCIFYWSFGRTGVAK